MSHHAWKSPQKLSLQQINAEEFVDCIGCRSRFKVAQLNTQNHPVRSLCADCKRAVCMNCWNQYQHHQCISPQKNKK